jgi:hypothetical protein
VQASGNGNNNKRATLTSVLLLAGCGGLRAPVAA